MSFVSLSILASVFWGCASVLDKLALSHLHPVTATVTKAAGTMGISIVVLSFFLIQRPGSQSAGASAAATPGRGAALCLASGALTGIGMFVFMKALLSCSEPHLPAAIGSIYPAFTLILGVLFVRGVRLTARHVIALSVIIAGVVMISLGS